MITPSLSGPAQCLYNPLPGPATPFEGEVGGGFAEGVSVNGDDILNTVNSVLKITASSGTYGIIEDPQR